MNIYFFQVQKWAQKPTARKIENEQKVVRQWEPSHQASYSTQYYDNILLANDFVAQTAILKQYFKSTIKCFNQQHSV
mgnify:CR=1 FL=1